MSHVSGAARAPYSLEPVAFQFPALAAMCGRAALGGARETAMACFVVGRLVSDACEKGTFLTPEQRKMRVAGVRHWLGAATLPGPVRSALVRLAEATGTDQKTAIQAALDSVMTVTANQLEQAARLELQELAQVIAE